MEYLEPSKKKGVKRIIVLVSIVIPLAVAALFGIKVEMSGFSFLPSVYAVINGLTAVVLIFAFLAIKKRNIELHRRLIRLALLLSLIFLVLYILYHMTSDPTYYGDENHDQKVDLLERAKVGGMAMVYYFFLITHILLSVAIVPLVLFSYLFAWEGNVEKHKKYVRFTFPLWLYVAITGVIVYLLISPYYL